VTRPHATRPVDLALDARASFATHTAHLTTLEGVLMRTPVSSRRLAAAVAGAAGLVLVTALPAAAHVTVSSPDAAPGGFGKLVFRVPNESDSASTTKVQVRLPSDTPFASVSTKPMQGWTVEAEPTRLAKPVEMHGATITEAVTTVTWTADQGSALPPDQFAEFEMSVGTLPEHADSVSFPTTQTYSDGEVVRWNEPVKEGAAEPEHPAPTLEIAAAHAEAVAPASDTSATSAPAGGNDGVARGLGGAAVLLAAGALLWSLLSARRAKA
jgi:uncharacterized protein YcnI